jgi:hypothetical protein
MDQTATLNQAIAAAQAGRKAEARRLLELLLDADERNEQAWLWLSGVVDSDEERIICLENVLTINPHNETARIGLVTLGARPAADQAPAPGAPQGLNDGPSALEGPQPASRVEPSVGDVPARGSSVTDSRPFIVITIALALILICTVISILAFVILSPV